jgi:hypothetical protein
MSNKYGYVGKDVPTQSFGSNKGVLNTDDLYELSNAGKLTQYGQLELIETQTVSGTPSTLSFDSIQESKYNVHFMTISEFQPQTDNRHLALRFKTGGVTDSNFNYKYAMQRNTVATSAELISGNDSKIWLAYNCSNISNETTNGYIYIYNAGDSSKYTFITTQFMMIDKDTNHSTNFQSGVYDIINVVNGIEFATSGDPLEYGTFSLYGIRYS